MATKPKRFCYAEATTLNAPFQKRASGVLECYRTEVLISSQPEVVLDFYTSVQLPKLPDMFMYHSMPVEIKFRSDIKLVEFPEQQTEAINNLIGRTSKRVGVTLSWENNWSPPNQGVWVKKESLPRALHAVHICKTIPENWPETLTVKQFALILYEALSHSVAGVGNQETIDNGRLRIIRTQSRSLPKHARGKVSRNR